jgi:hypothetical protein
MGAIAVAQSTLLCGVVFAWCNVPGSLGQQLVIAALLSLAGTTLGLAISALARSEELAVALVPIVIIPQIILADVVADLASVPEWFARLAITVYWGQRALEATLPEDPLLDPFLASGFEPTVAECGVVLAMHIAIGGVMGASAARWLGGESR